VAHVQLGDQTFIDAGLSPAHDFGLVVDAFSATIVTFSELTRQEADELQPDRIDFHVVRDGETWESIAGQAGGAVRAPTIAIMNGYDPGTPPRTGTRIRIVVGG